MMIDEVFMNTNWNKNKSNFTGSAVAVKKSRHEKYFFVVLFFKSGHGPRF